MSRPADTTAGPPSTRSRERRRPTAPRTASAPSRPPDRNGDAARDHRHPARRCGRRDRLLPHAPRQVERHDHDHRDHLRGHPVPATAKNKKMPRLIGQNVVAARTTLQQLELQPAVTPTASTQKPGTVLEQSPAAGSKLAPGSTVTLVVAQARSATTASSSTGATTTTSETTTADTTTTTAPPQPTTATMPDVSSQKEQAAVQSLNSAGILPSLAFVPGTDPLGTVQARRRPPARRCPTTRTSRSTSRAVPATSAQRAGAERRSDRLSSRRSRR